MTAAEMRTTTISAILNVGYLLPGDQTSISDVAAAPLCLATSKPACRPKWLIRDPRHANGPKHYWRQAIKLRHRNHRHLSAVADSGTPISPLINDPPQIIRELRRRRP